MSHKGGAKKADVPTLLRRAMRAQEQSLPCIHTQLGVLGAQPSTTACMHGGPSLGGAAQGEDEEVLMEEEGGRFAEDLEEAWLQQQFEAGEDDGSSGGLRAQSQQALGVGRSLLAEQAGVGAAGSPAAAGGPGGGGGLRLPRPFRGEPSTDDAFQTVMQWLHTRVLQLRGAAQGDADPAAAVPAAAVPVRADPALNEAFGEGEDDSAVLDGKPGSEYLSYLDKEEEGEEAPDA